MLPRFVIAIALSGMSTAAATASEPPSFEQRVAAAVSRPAAPDDKRAALSRLGREARSADQQITIAAFQTMVDSWQKADVKALADAESFATTNPRSGGALIALSYAQVRMDQPERAADALLAALAAEPRLVDAVSSSQVAFLLGNFKIRQDATRIRGLARSLFEAAWTKGTADDRSYLATELILDELRRGNTDQARRWLPAVRDPLRLYAMLADNRFAPLGGDIEQFAGKRLEVRWRDYLAETRDAWSASGEVDQATAYAAALQRAELHRPLVDQFLPRFVRGYNCPNDPAARAVAYYLVESLADLGQLSKAESVLSRSAGASGKVDANYLSYLYVTKGRYADAASIIERMLVALAKSKKPVDEVQMTLLRARLWCANHRRGAASNPIATNRLALAARLWVSRCLDRPAETKAMLLAALERDQDRLEALSWLQPDSDRPGESEFERSLRVASDQLRRDPEVVVVVARHGVIHDWPVTAGVPRDLSPAKPKRPPPCGTIRTELEEPQKADDLYEKQRPMP